MKYFNVKYFKLYPSAIVVFFFIVVIFAPQYAYPLKTELVLQAGHSNGTITSLVMSPDKKFLISASDDKKIIIWDMATRKILKVLRGHSHMINSIDISSDGNIIASGDGKGVVKIWNIYEGREISTFTGSLRRIGKVAFNTDNTILAILGRITNDYNRGTIIFINPSTGEKLFEIEEVEKGFSDITFSPDNNIFAASGLRSIQIHNILDGKIIRTINGHSHWVDSITFSKDGKILAGGDGEGKVKLWNVYTGKLLKSFKKQKTYIKSVKFSPDRQLLASGCGYSSINTNYGDIKVWDLNTSDEIITLKTKESESISSVIFFNSNILIGASGKKIIFWDINTGKELYHLKGYANYVRSVSFCPKDNFLASTSGKMIKLWDISTGNVKTLKGNSTNIKFVEFNPDGNLLYSVNFDGHIKVWDTSSGIAIKTIKQSSQYHTRSISFSPDGNIFATTMGRIIKLWSAYDYKKIDIFIENQHLVNSLKFSPDGRYLVSGGHDKKVILRSLKKNLKTHIIDTSSSVASLAFSSDGKFLGIGEVNNKITIWDINKKKIISTFKGTNSAGLAMTFSPDCKFLLTGDENGKICIWEFAKERKIKELKEHSDWVRSIEFSPDGKLFASASLDGSVNLWDSKKGALIASLISVDQKDHIFITPDKYYTGSIYGLRGIGIRINNSTLPIEQFDLRYNRPDIVIDRIKYLPSKLKECYYNIYRRRLNKHKITEDVIEDSYQLPELEILTKNLPTFTENKYLKFKIVAFDKRNYLDRISLTVNDVPVSYSMDFMLNDKKLSQFYKDITVELSNGRNVIQVSVFNNKKNESLRKTFEVLYVGPKIKPNLYLVSIGVSYYKNKNYNLKYSAKDANDFRNLILNDRSSYNSVHVYDYLNRDVTKSNLSQIKNYLKKSLVDDVVLIFYSGHGLLDENLNYFLSTYDIDFKNPSEKGLPYSAIEDMVVGIPARNKLIFIDSCHSGEIDKETFKEIKFI